MVIRYKTAQLLIQQLLPVLTTAHDRSFHLRNSQLTFLSSLRLIFVNTFFSIFSFYFFSLHFSK